ncbi:MAG: aminotransferase class IV [Microbacteriaceae bacterium]|nr:aminotransferase class IV [Microbacteriaceae bacterium]
MGISSDTKDEIFEWDGSLWIPTSAENVTGTLQSSTSFLVRDSRALTLELHLDRLIRQAKYWKFDFPLDAWVSALTLIHSFIDCWPRIDLIEDNRLILRIRAIPATSDSISITTWNGEDPRKLPEIKGPDLTSLMKARAVVNEQGADEGIICDASGFIAEGFTTGILWWDGEVLCLPTEKQPKLVSTAVQAILGIALGLGVEVKAEEAHPEQLHGKAVWTANALHGIRYVNSWIEGPEVLIDSQKAAVWQKVLDLFRQEIPTVK